MHDKSHTNLQSVIFNLKSKSVARKEKHQSSFKIECKIYRNIIQINMA